MTNIFNNKKNITNTKYQDIDQITVNSSLLIPRLFSSQKNILTPENGLTIYNKTTNKFEFYENNSWKEVTTNSAGITFMDLSTNQTALGIKKWQATAPGQLSHTIIENTHYDGISGSDIGLEFSQPNIPGGGRRKSIYMDGNGTTTAGTGDNGSICLYDHINSRPYIKFQGNITNNYIDLPIANSSIKIEGNTVLTKNNLTLNSATSTFISLQGADSNLLDMNFNYDIRTQTGTGFLDFNYSSQNYFRIDQNANFSMGPGTSTLSKIRLILGSGANSDHAIRLPQQTNTGQTGFLTTVGADPQYDGSIWYNSTIHEFMGLWNNTLYTFVHKGSSTGTNLNANAIHDGSVTNTQYAHLSGVSANIQTQLNNKVDLSTDQTITGKKQLNNDLIVNNGNIIRLRSDALISNPDIHCISYRGGLGECIQFATSDALSTTSSCFGYYESDLRSNSFIAKAAFEYNNLPNSCILKMNGANVLNSDTIGINIDNSHLKRTYSSFFDIRTQGNTADGLKINNVFCVRERETGWTNQMTGTSNKATLYDTSTITLEQLSERVKALEDVLRYHGLIGV